MNFSNTLLIATVLICQIFAVYGGDLPPEIQKCKSHDNEECIPRTVEKIFELYPDGNPQFGMSSPSAINLQNVSVSHAKPNSPIQLSFRFNNCTVYGMHTMKVLRTTGFDKQLNKVEFVSRVPKFTMVGDYESMGKILLLPINGHGKGTVEFIDSLFQMNVKLQSEKRSDGKTYAKIKKMITKFEPSGLKVNLENILNGNPELSQSINDVINENWKDVWTELQDGINRAMADFTSNIVNKILNELAIDDFYSD